MWIIQEFNRNEFDEVWFVEDESAARKKVNKRIAERIREGYKYPEQGIAPENDEYEDWKIFEVPDSLEDRIPNGDSPP